MRRAVETFRRTRLKGTIQNFRTNPRGHNRRQTCVVALWMRHIFHINPCRLNVDNNRRWSRRFSCVILDWCGPPSLHTIVIASLSWSSVIMCGCTSASPWGSAMLKRRWRCGVAFSYKELMMSRLALWDEAVYY